MGNIRDAIIGGIVIGVAATMVIAISYFVGRGGAQAAVAIDCEKLGSFYVHDVVYECRPKKVDK